MKSFVAASNLFLLSLLCACSAEVQHEKFPGGQGRTTDMQNAQTAKAVMGGIDPLNNPLANQDPHTQDGKELRGVVKIKGAAKLGEGRTFFLAARPVAGGPPMAARRLPQMQVKFPYSFRLTSSDRMMEGIPFEGAVILSARLDQDGDAFTRQPGDLIAEVQTFVGATDIVLEMEEVK